VEEAAAGGRWLDLDQWADDALPPRAPTRSR